MFQDPVFTAFIIYCAINAFIILKVWWMAIEAVIDYFRG
jgi:hypothetical protein